MTTTATLEAEVAQMGDVADQLAAEATRYLACVDLYREEGLPRVETTNGVPKNTTSGPAWRNENDELDELRARTKYGNLGPIEVDA